MPPRTSLSALWQRGKRWLLTGDTRGDARDARRARAQARHWFGLRNRRNVQAMVRALFVANLLFWPTDLLVFGHSPRAFGAFLRGRAALTALLLLWGLGLRYSSLARRHTFAFNAVLGSLTSVLVGAGFGVASEPGDPFFHFGYWFAVGPLAVRLVPLWRAVSSGAAGAAYLLGFLCARPSFLGERHFGSSLLFFLFVELAVVVSGIALDELRTRDLYQRLELRRAARLLEVRVAEQTLDLRRLASLLEVSREQERLRIARDLHDELGQELTALRYAVKTMRVRYGTNDALGPDLEKVSSQLDRVSAETRRILAHLTPRVLDEQGLEAALRWLCQEVRDTGALTCELTLEGLDTPRPRGADDAVFRVVQEALTNVQRHAFARRASVRVRRAEGELTAIVEDDGVGLPEELSRNGLGLVGMRARAQSLGGELLLGAAAQGGTLLTLRLPLEGPAT